MAADGDVTPTIDEITDRELRTLWRATQAIQQAANSSDPEALARLTAENLRLRAAIRWALGEVGEFREREFTAQGPYWWRTELRRRAALAGTP
jgi:hypothetical protein